MKAARGFVAFCFSIIMAALTNVVFAVTVLGFAWTMLGCGPAAVHVAPATSTSFQQMMAVEVTADARRPAHWMERYVRGEYIGALNVGVSKTTKVFVPGPNDSGELWIMFKRGELVWRLTWKTTAPGLLQYKLSQPDTSPEDDRQRREEAWRQAIKEGRWRDISKQEAEDNAKELFETVEGMVLRRDVLGLFRDGVTVAIDGVGAAAEVILSARLWNHIDTAPRLVPIVRVAPPVKPPPMKPPPVSIKPPPPVNARPLGSDTRMTPKNPRPAVPRKTPSDSRSDHSN